MSTEARDDGLSRQTEDFLQHYGQCQRQLYLFILFLLPNATDAQDVLQETSLVLWEKFAEYDTERSFFAWARGIAHRKVLKHRERKGRQAALFRNPTLQILLRDLEQYGDDERPMLGALDQCLERLNPADRELIKKRYAPGASVQALAATLGRTPNALSQSLRRIRQALLECITRRMTAEARNS